MLPRLCDTRRPDRTILAALSPASTASRLGKLLAAPFRAPVVEVGAASSHAI